MDAKPVGSPPAQMAMTLDEISAISIHLRDSRWLVHRTPFRRSTGRRRSDFRGFLSDGEPWTRTEHTAVRPSRQRIISSSPLKRFQRLVLVVETVPCCCRAGIVYYERVTSAPSTGPVRHRVPFHPIHPSTHSHQSPFGRCSPLRAGMRATGASASYAPQRVEMFPALSVARPQPCCLTSLTVARPPFSRVPVGWRILFDITAHGLAETRE